MENKELHKFHPFDDIQQILTQLDYAIRQSTQSYQISDAGKSPSEVYAVILSTLVKTDCITLACAKMLLVWSPATHRLRSQSADISLSKATFYSRFLDNYTKAHNQQWSHYLRYLGEPSTFVFNMSLSNVHSPFLGKRT